MNIDQPNWCCYFGVIGIDEYQFVPIGKGRIRAIQKVIGEHRDEEGTKQIWESIPEDRQFEVQYG